MIALSSCFDTKGNEREGWKERETSFEHENVCFVTLIGTVQMISLPASWPFLVL